MSRIPTGKSLLRQLRSQRKPAKRNPVTLKTPESLRLIGPPLDPHIMSGEIPLPDPCTRHLTTKEIQAQWPVSDSDGKFTGSAWSREPKPDAQYEADLQDQIRERQVLGELVVRMGGDPRPRQRWQGKGYELARKIRDELAPRMREKLGPNWKYTVEFSAAFTAALKKACREYVQTNGRPFTVKSLREGLRQRDDWDKGLHRRQR